MIQYIWLVPAFPLVGVVINGLFGRSYLRERAHLVAVPAAGLSFLVALLIALEVVAGPTLDIHIYSTGYMHGDPGYPRFFAYLNLFMFSMLILVLANNYLFMFLGWEGVGLCSYLLIGFWYEKKTATDAGNKAFLVNRVGDAGFLLGLFLLWTTCGTLEYAEVFAQAAALP